MKYLSPILQVAGLGLIAAAAASLSPILGAAVGGIALLLIGLSLESAPPSPIRRAKRP